MKRGQATFFEGERFFFLLLEGEKGKNSLSLFSF